MYVFPRDAACGAVDPELFFPPGDDYNAPGVRGQVAQAKAICRRCPVQAKCLDWALESGQDDGVWGCTTPDERRVMNRQLLSLSA